MTSPRLALSSRDTTAHIAGPDAALCGTPAQPVDETFPGIRRPVCRDCVKAHAISQRHFQPHQARPKRPGRMG